MEVDSQEEKTEVEEATTTTCISSSDARKAIGIFSKKF